MKATSLHFQNIAFLFLQYFRFLNRSTFYGITFFLTGIYMQFGLFTFLKDSLCQLPLLHEVTYLVNSKQLLFEAVFCVIVFLTAMSPKLNVFCHFNTISHFNYINHSTPLVPHWGGEIDICSRGLFCTKFNSKLLFEAFFV